MAKKVNITLNDEISYRNLLQETYNDSILLVNEATREISILESSVDLKNVIIEDVVKYMKAMTDLIKAKDNAISKKITIAQQLQSYLIKSNKLSDDENKLPTNFNMSEMIKSLKEESCIK